MDNFDFLPGSIYFMMVLKYFNVNMSTDITSVIDSFTSLALSGYPGLYVDNLAATAL